MHGFFVTVNCSKMFDSNETSYKIFIDKNKMSVVYELVEWIRFMFSLEKCFFLIHENSVIHELEDIKVLEILQSLEIRPCLRSDCIHSKMEKNLFSKLDLFTYWNEMRVHKLFEARFNSLIHKVPQNQQNHLNIKKKSNVFSLKPQQNFSEETDKSDLGIDQHAVTPPLKLTRKLEDNRSQVIDIMEEDVAAEHQLDFKKVNTSVSDGNINSDGKQTAKKIFDQNLDNLNYPNSIKLNLCAENSALSSSANKKQKFQSKSKKMDFPFSLGALLADIREKAQIEECKKNHEVDQTEKSSSSVCSANENAEDKILLAKKAYLIQNKDSREFRKRKRKHKKQNLMVPLNNSSNNMSWDYYEPSVSVKPNHIRFNDNDEVMETETIENNCNSFGKRSADFNSLDVSSSINQQISAPQLTAELSPVTKKNENNTNSPLLTEDQDNCEKLIDIKCKGLNCDNQTDSGIEKKEPDDSQENLPDIESLKQIIKHPKICLRFY